MEIVTTNIVNETDTFDLYQKMAKVIFRNLADLFRGRIPTGQFSYLTDALAIIKKNDTKVEF